MNTVKNTKTAATGAKKRKSYIESLVSRARRMAATSNMNPFLDYIQTLPTPQKEEAFVEYVMNQSKQARAA